jgi:hypothetical protein
LREAERELIAAYVSGCLTTETREKFEQRYLRSEEKRGKLKLAQLLYEHIKTGAARFLNAGDPLYGYFLGELPSDERLKTEERLLVDDDYKKRVECAEYELIAAYTLENPLEAERERFQQYFFNSEERIEKLRFAEAIYQYYEYIGQIEAEEGNREAHRASPAMAGRACQTLVRVSKSLTTRLATPDRRFFHLLRRAHLGAVLPSVANYLRPHPIFATEPLIALLGCKRLNKFRWRFHSPSILPQNLCSSAYLEKLHQNLPKSRNSLTLLVYNVIIYKG